MSHRAVKTCTMIICVLILFLTANKPATYASGYVRLTFESASDGARISTTIPGLRFSIPGGGNWFYGDTRTGKYDAPYPRGAFAVNGHGFAWIGQRVGEGRIDFTTGTATFFAAAFSSKESLSIAVYNTEGKQIAAQILRANANTGRLDTVRLEAPAGQRIAYVTISGTQNRWVMDDMETDAPLPAPKHSKRGDFALVTVVQQPTPSLGAVPGSIVSYTIVATNRGKGQAKNTWITLPFDPNEVRVVDARFNRASAWVSKLVTGAVELQTGPIGGGDAVTGTLRLMVLPGVAIGTPLGERLDFRWADQRGGGSGRSNLPLLAAAATPDNPPTYALAVAPESGAAGSTHTFTSPIFAPAEPVALWYDTPNGKSIAAGTVTADGAGFLSATFTTTGLPPGDYVMVSHGLWTGFTATAVFRVAPTP